MLDTGEAIALIKALGGKADQTQVGNAVSDYLDNHPEATTTVLDGSISYAKLNNALKETVDDVADKADKEEVPVEYGSGLGTIQSKSFKYGTTTFPSSTASGTGAVAVGIMTEATSTSCFAEGQATLASGQSAHAEGQSTKALGFYTHAEGYNTIANGGSSHVSGNYNVVDDPYPEWTANTAYEVGDIVKRTSGSIIWVYKCIVANSDSKFVNANWEEQNYGRMTYAEIVGNGTAEDARSNARALDWDGNEYLAGDVYVHCDDDSTGGTKLATEDSIPVEAGSGAGSVQGKSFEFNGNTISSGTASGVGAFAVGAMTQATGHFSHAEGEQTIASGLSAHAEGQMSNASGKWSHAEGGSTVASGDFSHVEGKNAVASGSYSHVEGLFTIANGGGSNVSGYFNVEDDPYPEWTANTSYEVGDRVKRTSGTTINTYECKTANNDATFTSSNWTSLSGKMTYAEIVGNGTADNARSNARTLDWDGNEWLAGGLTVEGTLNRGRKANTTVGEGSFAFGNNVTASGDCSISFGEGSTVSGDYSFASGHDNEVTGEAAYAEGDSNIVSGYAAHVEGCDIEAHGFCAHAEGCDTQANADHSHAEGLNTVANGFCAHAEGCDTQANADYSHVGGCCNVIDDYSNWPEWVSGTSYAVSDKVKRTITENNETKVTGYICRTANSDATFIQNKWTKDVYINYAEIVGNGTSKNARSNARALDWEGNEHLAGDVYIHCNNDSTGGAKLVTMDDVINNKFIVTFTVPTDSETGAPDLGSVESDKTSAEILAAYDSGKEIIGIYSMPMGGVDAPTLDSYLNFNISGGKLNGTVVGRRMLSFIGKVMGTIDVFIAGQSQNGVDIWNVMSSMPLSMDTNDPENGYNAMARPIRSIAAPTANLDAANKQYVDNTVKVSVVSPASGTTFTLNPYPVTYAFGEKATLTVTVTATTQYHFSFASPSSTATVLTMNGITGTMGDTIEAGKYYEVDIWGGIALIKSLEVTPVT